MNIQKLRDVGCVIENSIINADCLEALKYVKDESIDMIYPTVKELHNVNGTVL